MYSHMLDLFLIHDIDLRDFGTDFTKCVVYLRQYNEPGRAWRLDATPGHQEEEEIYGLLRHGEETAFTSTEREHIGLKDYILQ